MRRVGEVLEIDADRIREERLVAQKVSVSALGLTQLQSASSRFHRGSNARALHDLCG